VPFLLTGTYAPLYPYGCPPALRAQDFDPKKRITGIPGYNLFGAPGSKGIFGGDPEEEFGGIFSK
jgi:hypothetical protein